MQILYRILSAFSQYQIALSNICLGPFEDFALHVPSKNLQIPFRLFAHQISSK